MPHSLKQLDDLADAFGVYLKHLRLEHGGASRIRTYQKKRLAKVVRAAAANSPFLKTLYSGIDLSGEIRLEDLPIVDKRLMMENFDTWVTDPRLKLDDLERQIETDPEDQYYLDEYRIVATSGSSGLRGIFVYDRSEWRTVIAAAFRWSELFGSSPIKLSYKKLATIKADKPTHATSRLGQSMQLGMRHLLMIDATAPLSEIVAQLNEFQPEYLMGYASMISLLAVEQIEGRLSIAPEMIATFSEMLGEDRAARAREAWGITPFNHYGAGEQVMIAADCEAHTGLHLFEDLSIVEVVDKNNNPVPPGTPGHKILLTNLHKFVQPLIRYEITDIVTESTESTGSCICHRPFRQLSQIGGRTEDIIQLPGKTQARVDISPMLIFDCMIGLADVIEYQYGVSGAALKVHVVPRRGADRAKLEKALRASLEQALDIQGAADFTIGVRFSDHIPRSGAAMGKLKLTTQI